MRLTWVILYAYFFQLFINLQNLNLISQPCPATQQLGIFLSSAASLLGVPVAQQHVLGIASAVEKIAAVSFVRDDGVEFADGGERSGLHAGQRLPDREG